ncbi:MAG: lysylphosphatidylglycerol synthase transmembrane domain-containing protein, partial [Dehalococcoidia bacterium]
LNSPRKHLALFFYSLPVWLLEGSMYFMLAYSFGLDQHFDSVWVLLLVVLLLTATSNLATAVPSAIGGIGPFEIVAQQTLMALGVGASLAGVYSGFVHLVALWLPVNLAGLALLWKNNLSLREMTAASRAGGQMSESTGEVD